MLRTSEVYRSIISASIISASHQSNILHEEMAYVLTEFPASLDEGDLRVVHEERNSPEEKIGLRLEVGIKHGNVLAVFDVVMLQSFLERASLVPLPVPPDLVLYVHAFAHPSVALHLHQILKMETKKVEGYAHRWKYYL